GRAGAEVGWYGYQILLADAAAPALATAHGEPGVVAAFIGYLLAGPVIHAAHGDGTTAIIDFGLRLGAPIAGGAIASSRRHGRRRALLGAVGGMGIALATDWAGLSWPGPLQPGSLTPDASFCI